MADAKITALTEDTSPTYDDLLVSVTDPAGTPANRKVTIASLLKVVNAPQGFLINGKIDVTVASNNITVAIKTLAGADPSTTSPVIVRIGDSIRTITAALSVTKNAGTNWFNSGATATATYEIDYFVYLGYNATDGVVIGFARIPYAQRYADFSTTTTNDRYCAISTITTAAATDYYENIGRFAATLSATASFNWSVPTFTGTNLIQHPIMQTRWLTTAPVYTGFSADPSGVTARYRINGNMCDYWVSETGTGTSNATGKTISMPIATTTGFSVTVVGAVVDNGTTQYGKGAMTTGASAITFYPAVATANWTASGNCRLNPDGNLFRYEV